MASMDIAWELNAFYFQEVFHGDGCLFTFFSVTVLFISRIPYQIPLFSLLFSIVTFLNFATRLICDIAKPFNFGKQELQAHRMSLHFYRVNLLR
tara:strand:+ start:303 stop:584 length:282 start_codon:yes stop_codon:yes gene_type:complete